MELGKDWAPPREEDGQFWWKKARRAGDRGARSGPWSGEVDGGGQAPARGVGAGVSRRVRKDVHDFDGGEEGRWWRRGDRASGTISVAGTVGFSAFGAAGRRGNAAVQGRFKVAFFRAETTLPPEAALYTQVPHEP